MFVIEPTTIVLNQMFRRAISSRLNITQRE